MSIMPKVFHYQGRHCFAPCADSCKGKECQCSFDRAYERQCFEDPKNVTPAVVSGDQHQEDTNGK